MYFICEMVWLLGTTTKICSIKYLSNVLINFLERLEHQGKYLPIHFYIKNAVNLFIIVDYWPVCLYILQGLCQIWTWTVHGWHALLLKEQCVPGIIYCGRDKVCVLEFKMDVIFQCLAYMKNNMFCFLIRTNTPLVLRMWLLHCSCKFEAKYRKIDIHEQKFVVIHGTLKYSAESR